MKANHGPMVRGLLSKTCRRIFDAFVIDISGSVCAIMSCFTSSKRRNWLFETIHTIATSIEVDVVLNVCLSKHARRLTFEIRRASRVFRHPFARNRHD